MKLHTLMICFLTSSWSDAHVVKKRAYYDNTVQTYHSERTCWWNEVCKKEFQGNFVCRCPRWSFCRSPGRYYDAFCTMTSTGYIWMQPMGSSAYSDNSPIGMISRTG